MKLTDENQDEQDCQVPRENNAVRIPPALVKVIAERSAVLAARKLRRAEDTAE